MARLSDIPLAKTRDTVIVFGDPKTGKTTAVSELAKKHKLFWIDLENGGSTLRKLPIEAQRNIEYLRLPDDPDNPVALETVLNLLKGLPTNICQTHGKVNCALCKKDSLPFELYQLHPDDIVVIDSLTQFVSSVERKVLAGKSTDYKLQFDDYGKIGQWMEMFLSVVQAGRYNMVVITHAAEVEMENGGKKIVPIAGTSRFSRQTARFFRHAVYAEIKASKHRLVSNSTAYPNVVIGSSTDIDTSASNSLLPIFAHLENADA